MEMKWNDDDVQAWEDALHVLLDYLLDDMRGPSAAVLRRDRFKFWCSEHEYQFGRRIYGLLSDDPCTGGAWGTLDDDLFEVIKKSFHDRFMSAREHVLAAYMDTLRRHGHSVWIDSDKRLQWSLNSFSISVLGLRPKLGGDERFWEVCYPNGIQPKSQNDNWEDTQQIDLLHRLEPPDYSGDLTAYQTFPPRIAGCKECNQDLSREEVAQIVRREMKEYLDKFSLRPSGMRLGPIEAT